jgi:uncharacterized Zn-binding protein involved in type VI secretion
MPQNVKVGDIVIGIGNHGRKCCPHTVIGFVTTGSPDTTINGQPVARNNDIVQNNCPHCGVAIIIASGIHRVNGVSPAMLGDQTTGNGPGDMGTIQSGSPNVIS